MKKCVYIFLLDFILKGGLLYHFSLTAFLFCVHILDIDSLLSVTFSHIL